MKSLERGDILTKVFPFMYIVIFDLHYKEEKQRDWDDMLSHRVLYSMAKVALNYYHPYSTTLTLCSISWKLWVGTGT